MAVVVIKAKKLFAGPGTSWIAEALVDEGDANTLYVSVHYFDGENYSVSRESIYDALVRDDIAESCNGILEEYEDYEDAKESKYVSVFDSLRRVIEMLD